MTVVALTHEFAASKERFQKTLAISFVLHLVLFGWLMLRESISEAPEGIVEISWLDPLPETPPPAPIPERAEPRPVAEAKILPPSKTEEKFQRQEKPAEVQPSPQELTANRDMVKERLAALAPAKMPSKALTAEPRTANSLLKSAPVEAPDPGMKASTVDLKRSDNPRPKPADLKRAPVETRRTKPAIAPATVEKQTTAAAAMPDMDSVARRTLEGAELAGQIANRPVVSHAMPVYPEWAESQAVEATVTLYFVVLPDGRVKENIQVQKTAGFADFDLNAEAALRKWRFQALTGGAAGEQWGTITFRFRLNN
jgi:TonB family protein